MNLAQATATRSTCPRKQVGAVLTDYNGRILSLGYNGAPKDVAHCTDVGCTLLHDECIRAVHAEINALLNLEGRAQGLIAYLTHFPCPRCMGALVQAGCSHIIYSIPRAYPSPAETALIDEIVTATHIRLQSSSTLAAATAAKLQLKKG
jgi:dCMP deaminase